MQDFIASYLIQKKECHLPLLGSFAIKSVPASLDIANKKIFPSTGEIVFNETENYLSEGLKDYVAHLDNIPLHEAEEKINNWCLYSKVKLDSGEQINFDSIGSLQKDAFGNVLFRREKNINNFFEPVIAERVIHQNAEHAVLVGDKQTTSVVMNEFYKEDIITQRKTGWKMWAGILFAVSLLVLIIYFYSHSFSENGIARQSAFPIQPPPATYSAPR